MRVALVCDFPNSAIHSIFRQVSEELARCSREAVIVGPGDRFIDFDLVHFGYLAPIIHVRREIEFPMTANLWSPPRVDRLHAPIPLHNIDRIVVNDPMTRGYLGYHGYTNVVEIPMPVDHRKFRPLPPPDGDFSVGCFGNNYAPSTNRGKRFFVIEEACRAAKVKYVPWIFDPGRVTYDADPLAVYQSMHVYAHASFSDTDSLTVREALLCGRPAIAVPNPRLREVIQEGHNGFFFDGSVPNLIQKIQEAQAGYETLRRNAPWSPIWPVATIADAYWRVWESVLE